MHLVGMVHLYPSLLYADKELPDEQRLIDRWRCYLSLLMFLRRPHCH